MPLISLQYFLLDLVIIYENNVYKNVWCKRKYASKEDMFNLIWRKGWQFKHTFTQPLTLHQKFCCREFNVTNDS